MGSQTSNDQAPRLSREQALRWRDSLRDAGYDEATLRAALGAEQGPESLGTGPLRTWTDLLLRHEPVSLERYHQACAPAERAALEEGGVIVTDAGAVRAQIAVVPRGDLLVASDPDPPTDDGFVMGVSEGTLTVATTMIPKPQGRVMDLGSGSGMIALIAADIAEEVVAVDLNPRALAFVSLNASLNDRRNITTRIGDMFALDSALHGRFDGVYCHPPHVISPQSGKLWCDGPGDDDDFMPRLMNQCAALLRPGGVAQILGNWAELEEEAWQPRLQGWLDATGCDAWAMVNPMESPRDYAERWLGDRGSTEAGALATWLAHYAKKGVTGLYSGLVTLRRRTDEERPWCVMDPAPPRIGDGAGDHLKRGLRAIDRLERMTSDEPLGRLEPSAPPSLRQEVIWEIADGRWRETTCRTRLTKGLCYERTHDRLVASLVRRCDGATPVDAIVDDLAVEYAEDAESLREPARAVVRELVHFGLLVVD